MNISKPNFVDLGAGLRALTFTLQLILIVTLSTDVLAECGNRTKSMDCDLITQKSSCTNSYDWSNDGGKYECKWSSGKCISGSACPS